MSSIGSCTSFVSFRGDCEIDLETCLDELYKDVQQNLNNSQCSVRELARLTEDDDYIECLGVHWAVVDYVDVLADLFKELKEVSKQVLGPCPKQLREEVKTLTEARKNKNARAKADAKEQAKLIKQAEKLNIIAE
jgi:hypothetical protein